MAVPRYVVAVVSILVAYLAFVSQRTSTTTGNDDIGPSLIRGRNETVLFLINAEYGLSNVHLALMQGLFEQHPNIEVHVASFPKAASRISRIATFAGNAKVSFHNVSGGPTYWDAFRHRVGSLGLKTLEHPPGLRGLDTFSKVLQIAVAPWSPEHHQLLYRSFVSVINEVDPAIVVLDASMRPAVDASVATNRFSACVIPNAAHEMFWGRQPGGKGFWKYPMMASGYEFPVPWYNVPLNMYFAIRFIYSMALFPSLPEMRPYFKENGFRSPLQLINPDAPWIVQHMPNASLPLDFSPESALLVTPMVLRAAPVVQQDAELFNWLQQRPTVLINLGTLFRYNRTRADIMAECIRDLLEETDIQVLWKLAWETEVADKKLPMLDRFVAEGRVRITDWLTADTVSILEVEQVVAFVHHGGASSYHEAIASGVPQVIIPMWTDLYTFANLVEWGGIGVYAIKSTAPEWNVHEIRSSLFRVVGESGEAMRENARKLAVVAQSDPGRYAGAKRIAELAAYSKDAQ